MNTPSNDGELGRLPRVARVPYDAPDRDFKFGRVIRDTAPEDSRGAALHSPSFPVVDRVGRARSRRCAG